MTREEAIASYEKLYAYMVGDDDAIELDYGEFMELNHYIRSALRPVSREQVKKVWRGEWGRYCFSDDSHGYQCKNCGVQLDDPVYYRSFCPKCGKAMTDEAVEMVLERLEALHEHNA